MNENPEQFRPNVSSAVTLRAVRQSDEKHCHACGRIVHASAASCPSCGAAQAANAGMATRVAGASLNPSSAIYCYGCGGQIHAAAHSCPACGAPQRAMAAHRATKDRTTAIVLAFLLGGIGAHRFYLGSPGWGIAYLLFSWTFVPAVVALIEGFVYVAKSNEDFARLYG